MSYKKGIKVYMSNIEIFMNKGIGLYLWSKENSTGKTAIAVLCIKRVMELGKKAMYITSEDFKDAMITREMFDESQSVYSRAIDVDILVLDDIAKEYRPEKKEGMGFAESQIQKLLRVRTQARKATIFTSNRHPKEMRLIYGDSLVALLKANIKQIEIAGIDWRAIKEKDVDRMFKELGD